MLTGGRRFAAQTAKIEYMAAPQVTFTPFRGKFAIFNKIFVDTDLDVARWSRLRGDRGARKLLWCSVHFNFVV